jgi:hypothetical protein
MARSNAIKGFLAKYNSDALLKELIPGGVWLGEVPEGSDGDVRSMPYIQLETSSTSYEWTFEDANIETSLINVHFFATGADTIDTICDAWQDSFNWQDLPGTNSETICVELTTDSLMADSIRDKEGNLVYFASQTYLVKLFHSS